LWYNFIVSVNENVLDFFFFNMLIISPPFFLMLVMKLNKTERTKDKLKEKQWLSAFFQLHVYVPEQESDYKKFSQGLSVVCHSARETCCQEKQGWQIK